MIARILQTGGRHAWLLPVDFGRLRRAAAVMLEAAGVDGLVELCLVRDADSAALNARWLDCTGPTNVLAFPGDGPVRGSLVLSVDAVRREALLYGRDETEHCLRLLAHGLAHLAGYDHGPEMDRLCERMQVAWERCDA